MTISGTPFPGAQSRYSAEKPPEWLRLTLLPLSDGKVPVLMSQEGSSTFELFKDRVDNLNGELRSEKNIIEEAIKDLKSEIAKVDEGYKKLEGRWTLGVKVVASAVVGTAIGLATAGSWGTLLGPLMIGLMPWIAAMGASVAAVGFGVKLANACRLPQLGKWLCARFHNGKAHQSKITTLREVLQNWEERYLAIESDISLNDRQMNKYRDFAVIEAERRTQKLEQELARLKGLPTSEV